MRPTEVSKKNEIRQGPDGQTNRHTDSKDNKTKTEWRDKTERERENDRQKVRWNIQKNDNLLGDKTDRAE